MTSDEMLVLGRIAERLIITVFSGFAIYAGYQLFKIGVVDPQSGELKGKGFSVKLQRCGPGIFFALFGAIILGMGLANPLTIRPEPSVSPTLETGTNDILGMIANPPSVRYGGNQLMVAPLDVCQSISTLEHLDPPNSEGALIIPPQRMERFQFALTNLSLLKRWIVASRFTPDDLELYRLHAGKSDEQLLPSQRRTMKEIRSWSSEGVPVQ